MPDEGARAAPVFWLVDPLDGTKEFVARNGEFTVNIALIEQGRSVLGVVTVPAQNVSYWGLVGEGASLHEFAVRGVSPQASPQALPQALPQMTNLGSGVGDNAQLFTGLLQWAFGAPPQPVEEDRLTGIWCRTFSCAYGRIVRRRR